jgi:hypothetical protein
MLLIAHIEKGYLLRLVAVKKSAVVIISLKLTGKKIEAAVCPPPFFLAKGGGIFLKGNYP